MDSYLVKFVTKQGSNGEAVVRAQSFGSARAMVEAQNPGCRIYSVELYRGR